MNFNDLEKTWDRQTVTGDSSPLAAALSRRLTSEVRHERRRVLGGIAVVTFALLVSWAVTIGFHFAGIAPINRMGVVSLTVGSLIDAAFFVLAIRSARRIQAEVRASGGNLLDSVNASLRTIESRMHDTILITYGLPAVALISSLRFFARYLAGAMPRFGAVAGSLATFAFCGAVVAAMWWRYRRHLVPRRAELRQLAASLAETK